MIAYYLVALVEVVGVTSVADCRAVVDVGAALLPAYMHVSQRDLVVSYIDSIYGVLVWITCFK